MSTHLHFTPVGADRPHLWTAAALAWGTTNMDALAHLGLRTGSETVADALALSASAGRFTADALRGAHWDLAVVYPAAFASLALFWSASRCPDDHQAGAAAYSWLLQVEQLPEVKVHHQAAAQALFLADRRAELSDVLPRLKQVSPEVSRYLTADLAHPAWNTESTTTWMNLLSQPFVEHGLAPLGLLDARLAHSGAHLFDRLTASAPTSAKGGPLVSVVIPCWQPDDGLLTSVRSIREQSYPDLEIVVVDDASGPAYTDVFDRALSLDPRARLVRLDKNKGSYVARQAGIDQSLGEYVTTQDADDWSHPERLERQVSALLQHRGAPSSRSLAVRARDDLTHQWFGYSPIRWNASSLLLRRDVIDRVGPYLPIRKSGDSEFAERVTTLIGAIVEVPVPLAVTRLRSGTLSRGDFTYQWAHPDRIAFRGMYRAWHRHLQRASSEGGVEALHPWAPRSFIRGSSGVPTSPDRMDICILADFSAPPNEDELELMSTVLRLQGVGLSVGLWHVETPRADRLARRDMHNEWFDYLLSSPEAHVVTRTQPVDVGHLAVMDPRLLLLAARTRSTDVRADEVVVALHERDLTPGTHGLTTDLLDSMEAAKESWGNARWVYAPNADTMAVDAGLPHLPIERHSVWTGPDHPSPNDSDQRS